MVALDEEILLVSSGGVVIPVRGERMRVGQSPLAGETEAVVLDTGRIRPRARMVSRVVPDLVPVRIGCTELVVARREIDTRKWRAAFRCDYSIDIRGAGPRSAGAADGQGPISRCGGRPVSISRPK
jgi:hypothetical protein